MCMKYEKEYDCCFDPMEGWGSSYSEKSLPLFLGEFNINVKDRSGFISMFFEVLAKAHENKIIQPMTKEEKELWETEISTHLSSYKEHIDFFNRRRE